MHTIQFLLKTTKYEEQIIDRRFHMIVHIHNVMVKHAQKCLKKLSVDKEYLAAKEQYCDLLKVGNLSKEDKALKKELSGKMNDIVRSYGLSDYTFQFYLKVCGKQFKKHISSEQVAKEATRVWQGVEKVLYGDGEEIHFKKYEDFNTIGGKSNKNGAKFNKETLTVDWNGLHLKCKHPKDRGYTEEALNADISYCEIKIMMFPNGWHYYAVVYLKGDSPKKIKKTGNSENVTWLDVGVSTVAAVSDGKILLRELAPESMRYNRQIEEISRYLSSSRRATNPNKYNPDGTNKKGDPGEWQYSNGYLKARQKLKSLYRQKAASIKQSHEKLINELLADSVNFVIEDKSFKELKKKKGALERQNKPTDIVKKDGTVKQVYKFKRRKQYGRSIKDRAPSEFVTILKRKATLYGGTVTAVDNKVFKVHQYDHVADEYVPTQHKKIFKVADGQKVQRNLYNAFLLKNATSDLSRPDRDECILRFDDFVNRQDQLIQQIKENKTSKKACFGF